jgi:hypothetical protein
VRELLANQTTQIAITTSAELSRSRRFLRGAREKTLFLSCGWPFAAPILVTLALQHLSAPPHRTGDSGEICLVRDHVPHIILILDSDFHILFTEYEN